MARTRSVTSRAQDDPPRNTVPTTDQNPPEAPAPAPNTVEFMAKQLQNLTNVLTQFIAGQKPPPSAPLPSQNAQREKEHTRVSERDDDQQTESGVGPRDEGRGETKEVERSIQGTASLGDPSLRAMLGLTKSPFDQ